MHFLGGVFQLFKMIIWCVSLLEGLDGGGGGGSGIQYSFKI